MYLDSRQREREIEPLLCNAGFDMAVSKQIFSLSSFIRCMAGTKGNTLFTSRQGTPVIICEVKKIHLHSRRGLESVSSLLSGVVTRTGSQLKPLEVSGSGVLHRKLQFPCC